MSENKPRLTEDGKLIVYPNDKDIYKYLCLSRQSGKRHRDLAILEAIREAEILGEPVVVQYGMQLTNINE